VEVLERRDTPRPLMGLAPFRRMVIWNNVPGSQWQKWFTGLVDRRARFDSEGRL
jgi:hypothetical protein